MSNLEKFYYYSTIDHFQIISLLLTSSIMALRFAEQPEHEYPNLFNNNNMIRLTIDPFYRQLTSRDSLSNIKSRLIPKNSLLNLLPSFFSFLRQGQQAWTAAGIQEPSSSTALNLAVKIFKN